MAETEVVAIKRVIAYQVSKMMKKQKISKVTIARQMNTGRSALDRLLDPQNTSITLQTSERAAHAIGKRLRIEFA